MRVLMTATVPSMIGQFNMNNIKLLLELGYEVDVACNFLDYSVWAKEKIDQFKDKLEELNVNMYQVDFERKMFKVRNHLKSYRKTKQLINNRKYNLIHTHTPISSLITRYAFKHSQIYNLCRMVYTAHGFHFYKGNNLLKNLIFRNIERVGARYTDILITINKEDYIAAKRFKLRKNGRVEYIPGVGIDLDKIDLIQGNKEKLCRELNISNASVLLLSVGELNNNKNHKIVIESLPTLPKNVHYLICGVGALKEQYEEQAKKLQIFERLHLLGYRNDVIEIIKSCDIFIFPSKREGLSVALMEAMACGIPCIVSKIRGNVDLINNSINGYIFDLSKCSDITKYVENIIQNNCSFYSKNEDIKQYDIKSILSQMRHIYLEDV